VARLVVRGAVRRAALAAVLAAGGVLAGAGAGLVAGAGPAVAAAAGAADPDYLTCDAAWGEGGIVNGPSGPIPYDVIDDLWEPNSVGYIVRGIFYCVSILGDVATCMSLLLFFRVILTWFSNINWEAEPYLTLKVLTDPYLAIFRRIIPPFMGAMDITPIIGFIAMQWFEETLDIAGSFFTNDTLMHHWLSDKIWLNEYDSTYNLNPFDEEEWGLNPLERTDPLQDALDDAVEAYVDSEPEEAREFPESLKGFFDRDGDEDMADMVEVEGFEGPLGPFTLPVDEPGALEAERDLYWKNHQGVLDEVREVEAEGGDLDAHRARMGEEAETECPSWWRYPRTAGIVMT